MSAHIDIFYVPPAMINGTELEFPERELHHLHRVLRKNVGDVVQVVDGEGARHEVEITFLEKSAGKGKILKTRRRFAEPLVELVVAHGTLKGERFDWFVEKATEIGIRRIIPLLSQGGRVSAVRSESRRNRWERIAIAAMKQSGRSILPHIDNLMTLDEVLETSAAFDFKVIAHPHINAHPLKPVALESIHSALKCMVLIGPESGFTDEEVELAAEFGFESITLGPRRLRSETAGIVLLSLLMWHFGELE